MTLGGGLRNAQRGGGFLNRQPGEITRLNTFWMTSGAATVLKMIQNASEFL